MPPSALPAQSYRLFLLVRRGLPILGAAILTALAVFEPLGRGWYLLGAVFLLAEIWPTFKTGQAYLKARTAINRWDGRWVVKLRPLARRLGFEEAWILSFCAWNNHRVQQQFSTHKARRALVLLPHCIQLAKCKAEILTDLSACYDCGLCDVGDLLKAQLAHGWESRITNRSHKAYREAREFKPELIVGISCVDRLLKALIKLPDVPSYVIPLSLPHGMCVDTRFSVPHLLAAMETLVEPRAEAQPAGRITPLQREA
jgi:hypothetical protein